MTAPLDAQFQVFRDEAGEHRIRFVNRNGAVVPIKPGRIVGVRPTQRGMKAARAALAALIESQQGEQAD